MKLFKPYTTKTGTHHPFTPVMHGTKEFTFSTMVKDGIDKHGLTWAVRFYRLKHGLSGAEFRVFAGI